MIKVKLPIEYRKKFLKWKKEHTLKSLPKGISQKEKKELINEYWLIKDRRQMWISGAGRICLWMAYIQKGWQKSLQNSKKYHSTPEQKLEVLKFMFRQELYGINLLKKVDKFNAPLLINEGGTR